MGKGEFSVYWWGPEGEEYVREKSFVDAEEAMGAVARLTRSPASLVVKRCIITDGGDCCAFEWIEGKVVFPKKEDR